MTTLAQHLTTHKTLQNPKTLQMKNKNLEAKKQKDTYNQFCKLANFRGTLQIVNHILLQELESEKTKVCK
jgi:hypothetical protein